MRKHITHKKRRTQKWGAKKKSSKNPWIAFFYRFSSSSYIFTRTTIPNQFKFSLFIIHQLLGILCMALAAPYGSTSTELFLTVVILAFIFTLLWVAAYYLGVREVLNLAVNWILTVNTAPNNVKFRLNRKTGHTSACGLTYLKRMGIFIVQLQLLAYWLLFNVVVPPYGGSGKINREKRQQPPIFNKTSKIL